MPKGTKSPEPEEVKSTDVVIELGVTTGYEAAIGGVQIVGGVATLEEAEATVRAEIAQRSYKPTDQPKIWLLDADGMWLVEE